MHTLTTLFGPSKYINCYFRLISKRRQLVLDKNIVSEPHHIIPKSLGGSNAPDNIVRLTVREHYIAHLLLYNASKYSKNKQVYWKQLYSLNSFIIQKRKEPFIIPSKLVEKIRKANNDRLVKFTREERIYTKEHIQTFKNNHWTKMGIQHPMQDKKHTNESKSKMSRASAKWWCKAISPCKEEIICKSTHELAKLANTNVDTISKYCNTNIPVPTPGKRYVSQSTPERLNAVGWVFYRQLEPFTV